jgi:hypothetical protein
MNELEGASGTLFLDQGGLIHRRLAWAQFQGGEVVALPDLGDLGGPIQDMSNDGEIIVPGAADDSPWDVEQLDL